MWTTFTVSNSWRPAQEKKGSWVSFGAFWHGGVRKAPDERCESHVTTRTLGDELGVSDRVELVLYVLSNSRRAEASTSSDHAPKLVAAHGRES